MDIPLLFDLTIRGNEVVKKNYLVVPVELVEYAHKHKMHRALGIYLLMKGSCDGHMKLTPDLQKVFMTLLGIKDKRSFNKHLERLRNENWVGYDTKQQVYYIRGIKELIRRYGFYNTQAVVFYLETDAQNIQSFIHGAIICQLLRKRINARNVRIRKHTKSSALKYESALQELIARRKISDYIGLSVSLIGSILGVSQSQADRVKMRLDELGYLSRKKKYNVLHVSSKPDFQIFKHLPSNRRYLIKKKSKKGIVRYEFLERTYDELIPNMDFRNQRTLIKKIKKNGVYDESERKTTPVALPYNPS